MQPLLTGDPKQIASYRILGRLGAGGMGVVFLAQTERGTPVAVKTLGIGGDPNFAARFAREVEAALRVSSPYTAQVLDADTDADLPYLVTEYVAGETLRDRVDRLGPMDAELVTATAAGLAAGLQAIHQAGVVHRDLSATNIMLTPAGPRIIDLGIASVEEATRLTQTGTTMGTPGFMAPEHARGEEIGPAADVFAWGSLVTFAATGASPFGEGRAEQVLYRIVHEQPSLTGLPDLLVPHVTAALAKVPESRPQAGELVSQLVGQLAPTSPTDLPPTAAITQLVAQTWSEVRDLVAKPAPVVEGSATPQSAPVGETGRLDGAEIADEATIALQPPKRRKSAGPAIAAAFVLLLGAGTYAVWPLGETGQTDSEVTASADESSRSAGAGTAAPDEPLDEAWDSAEARTPAPGPEPSDENGDTDEDPPPQPDPEPRDVGVTEEELIPDGHAELGRNSVQLSGGDGAVIFSENEDYSEFVDDRVTATLALLGGPAPRILDQQRMEDCRFLQSLENLADGTTQVLCHWGATAIWQFSVSVEDEAIRIVEEGVR